MLPLSLKAASSDSIFFASEETFAEPEEALMARISMVIICSRVSGSLPRNSPASPVTIPAAAAASTQP
ncbi:hypothetical protein D3C72_2504640 [compost metagenome]